MDFNLDEDQGDLRDTLRRLLAGADAASPLDRAGRDDVWGQLGDLGMLDLRGPEALGPVDRLVLAQELGRTRVRVPFIESVVSARLLEELGEDAPAGLVVLAHPEPRAPYGYVAHGVSAEQRGDGWHVSGAKEPVSYAEWADAFLVTATVAGGTRVFLVDARAEGVAISGYDTHDHAGAGRVELQAAAGKALGEVEQVEPALRRAFAEGAAALCAEAVGAMDVAVATTVAYLKSRRQFGTTLQRFQALQHRAADMFIELELARSMAAYAAMSLDVDEPDLVAVSRAKVQIGRSARFVGQNAIQLHGGIGITDEHPIGHFTSRLEAIEHAYGGVEAHLAILAAAMDPDRSVEVLH